MRFYEKTKTKEDLDMLESRRGKAEKDLDRLIQSQNRTKAQAEAEKKLISDEMDSLFHRLEALRQEKSTLEKERDALLRSDWALEIEQKGREAEEAALKAQKAIQDASLAADGASEAKRHYQEALRSLEGREAAVESAKMEIRLSRESLEISRKEFMDERKRVFALVDKEREAAEDLLEEANHEREMNRHDAIGIAASREQLLAYMDEIKKEKRLIESRQQALKLAIKEKGKGVQ